MDLYRKLQDVAVQSGRLYQSQKTGFVHDTPETISIVTNALFALALFRQKSAAEIQEAKFILDRLLFFQNESGNFPIFLHDFPYCRDHYVALKMKAPLYWIQKEFSGVIGEALSVRLQKSLEKLNQYIATLTPQKKKPFHEMTPQELGDAVVQEQMSGKVSDELWETLEKSWCPHAKRYIGEAAQNQVGFFPEITLYDYMLGLFSETPNEAILKPQFNAIQAALLVPEQRAFQKMNDGPFAVSLRKTNEPFFLLAGVHTALAVLPGGNVEEIQDGKIVMQLAEEISPDNIEKADVFSMFFDAQQDVELFVNRQKATTFQMKDGVEVRMGNVRMAMGFEVEGEVQYMGHIVKGNRPRQKMNDRAYDWQLLLRKLRGSGKSRLRMNYSIQ